MVKLFNQEYSKQEFLKRIGNLKQIGGVERVSYTEGWSKGVDAILVNTGVLRFTVLPSRCLDIAHAECCGIPFSYLSKSEIKSAEYFDEQDDKGFLRNFFGGLLTTCGLHNIGSGCETEGRLHGTHGTISNVPAEDICIRQDWNQDEYEIEIAAKMNDSCFYAEHLVLERRIKTRLGSARIQIIDTIENMDFKSIPFFLLYHINLGFPFVDGTSKLIVPTAKSIQARTHSALSGMKRATSFCGPQDGMAEECFYYDFADNDVKVSLWNPNMEGHGKSVYLKYKKEQFPVFTEWKMMRSREYVCGFAPSTNRLEGRTSAMKNEDVFWLEPLEKMAFEIEIGIEPYNLL